jgi:hypothetical protein
MKKILEKARMILRNVYAALGAAAMPVLIHAAYGMPEPDPSTYTVPLQGKVFSEETGDPVAGIHVRYGFYVAADTGSDGRFLIYVPEEDSYTLDFFDNDGFESGGYFTSKSMNITREKIEDPLAVSLYRERQAAVIRGTVRAQGTGEPVSGISVAVFSRGGNRGEAGDAPFFGFEVLSDNDGQFYIQVPKRDAYVIQFVDTNDLFQPKQMDLTSDKIKAPLKVDLEQRIREEAGGNGE